VNDTLIGRCDAGEMRDLNYFALDLELNNKSDGSVPKIIQVGVAVGNPVRSEFEVRSWYINPLEPIVPEITRLTGITDQIIQSSSVTHDTLACELAEFLNNNSVFVNPVTWGQGDAEELKAELRERSIHFPHFGRRIIDVKTIFVFLEMTAGRSTASGLSKAMAKYGIEFIGKSHRADNDAYNTLRFYFELMRRQSVLNEVVTDLKQIRGVA